MKKRELVICGILLFCLLPVSAQQLSPYLFGQNFWMAAGDEAGRPGYISQLWPKIKRARRALKRIQ